MKVHNLYSLKNHNTFGIECFADKYIEYNSLEELQSVLLSTQKWLHIGKGSNLLFTGDFQGTILHSNIQHITIHNIENNSVYLDVGAGVLWDEFVFWTLNNNFFGLENLSLIPGEVGAASVQNIGAYGVEVSDYIEKVKICDKDGQTTFLTKEEMEYGYRHSILKTSLLNKAVVTNVYFKLSRSYSPILKYSAIEKYIADKKIDITDPMSFRKMIIDIRNSKLPDPSIIGNAGSFFMNPIVSKQKFEELNAIFNHIPAYSVQQNQYKIPAAWLIEKSGWKGRRIGNVGTYYQQPLVIINCGNCTGQDIKQFSELIINDVYEKFGIKLIPEVRFI